MSNFDCLVRIYNRRLKIFLEWHREGASALFLFVLIWGIDRNDNQDYYLSIRRERNKRSDKMSKQLTYKQHLVNPDKWVGKYVRHLANWQDFQFGDVYSVCEWTGKLMLTKDDAYYGDYFETKQEAESAGYDECYYYSEAGLLDMARKFYHRAA